MTLLLSYPGRHIIIAAFQLQHAVQALPAIVLRKVKQDT